MNIYTIKKHLGQLGLATLVMMLFTLTYLVNLSQNKKVTLYLENQKTLANIQSKIGHRMTFHQYQAIKMIESKVY